MLGLKYFERIYDAFEVGWVEAASMQQVMRMLQAGRGDYSVVPPSKVESLMQETGIQLRRCYDQALIQTASFLYLHLKHVDKLERLAASIHWLRQSQAEAAKEENLDPP